MSSCCMEGSIQKYANTGGFVHVGYTAKELCGYVCLENPPALEATYRRIWSAEAAAGSSSERG